MFMVGKIALGIIVSINASIIVSHKFCQCKVAECRACEINERLIVSLKVMNERMFYNKFPYTFFVLPLKLMR